MEPHEKIYKNRKRIFIDNLIGGLAWAIGATMGLAIIGFVLSKVGLVPIIGDFVSEITKYILQKNPQLLK